MIQPKTWRLWFYPAIAVFLVIEGIAIYNGVGGDTLSEYVWGMATWKRVVIVSIVGWLIAHFATKGKV